MEEAAIESGVVERVARLLGVSVDAIDVETPFASYGMSSISAVSLAAELEEWLGIEVDPTVAYEEPTISRLVGYLGVRLGVPDGTAQ